MREMASDFPPPNTAVLLAAGRGKRMGALTDATPKPLLRVKGRPIIEWIIGGLQSAGITHVIVVTGYLADELERALRRSNLGSVHFEFVRQEKPLGTARALLDAAHLIPNEPFVLGWGDILVEPDFYPELLADFRRAPCDVVLAVNEMEDPSQGGAVYFGPDHRVTRMVEKPAPGTSTTRWNNAGVFVMMPKVIEYARRLAPSPRGEYELPQALAAMVDDGLSLRALPIRGYWSDVGTPADFERANIDFPGR